MIKIVVGSGSKRHVEELQQGGKAMHEQRRAIKQHIGLIR